MKILVIQGSGRSKGNTAQLIESFKAGCEESGHSVEVINLIMNEVRGCTGCNACRFGKPCVQDVFITTGPFGNECPEGFCAMAWQAVCLQATTLAGGGKVFGHDEVHIACCNDGVRPVIFRLEGYVDDEEPVF